MELTDVKKSFICRGEKNINGDYLNIIYKEKSKNFKYISFFRTLRKTYDYNTFHYLFVGDVFGNLSVYQKINNVNNSNNIKNNKIEEVRYDKRILNEIKSYNLMKILTDHISEIKYIDYNPRLNLLVDYALDGYINLYIMPTLKLVHSIQTLDFNINEVINYVLLISNPFPMICCITFTEIIIFDINGEFINRCEITNDISINICIDKNCGLYNDTIYLINKNYQKISVIDELLNKSIYNLKLINSNDIFKIINY